MSIVRTLLLAGLMLAVVPSAAGAADAVIPLPGDVRADLDKYLGKGIVGEPVASPPLMTADDYLPPLGTAMTYRVLEEDEPAHNETHKVENTTDPLFAPGWRYARDPAGALYLQKAADGGAVVVGEEDRDNEVISRFTPGEPLLIAGLKPGESRKVAVKVQVTPMSNPKKVTHKGALVITYTYIGTYKLTVPAGSFAAQLIKWEYRGSVGPADIKQTDYRFLAPHAGLVAMIESRHISAMLIYNDKTKLGKLLQANK